MHHASRAQTSQGARNITVTDHRPRAFRRAIGRRARWMAEDAARELPNLPLEGALQLVHLYAERGSPKYEKAAMRWREQAVTHPDEGRDVSVL